MIITQGLGSNLMITQGYGWPMYVFLIMIALIVAEEHTSIIVGTDEDN